MRPCSWARAGQADSGGGRRSDQRPSQRRDVEWRRAHRCIAGASCLNRLVKLLNGDVTRSFIQIIPPSAVSTGPPHRGIGTAGGSRACGRWPQLGCGPAARDWAAADGWPQAAAAAGGASWDAAAVLDSRNTFVPTAMAARRCGRGRRRRRRRPAAAAPPHPSCPSSRGHRLPRQTLLIGTAGTPPAPPPHPRSPAHRPRRVTPP